MDFRVAADLLGAVDLAAAGLAASEEAAVAVVEQGARSDSRVEINCPGRCEVLLPGQPFFSGNSSI